MSLVTPLDAPTRQALTLADTLLQAAQASGLPFDISQAWTLMAHSHRELKAFASSESCCELALRWGRVVGSVDHTVDLLCAASEAAVVLAEALAQAQTQTQTQTPTQAHTGCVQKALERARAHAFEASTLAGRVADPRWEATVLMRISDVFNRCGDNDDAVLLQTRALRLMSGSLVGVPDPKQLPSLGRLADA
jgi:hypothetical protein